MIAVLNILNLQQYNEKILSFKRKLLKYFLSPMYLINFHHALCKKPLNNFSVENIIFV